MTQLVPLIHVTTVVTALKTITLVLGAMITYFAYKAYDRTGARPLGLLALGFAIATLGSLLAGVVDLWGPAFDLSLGQGQGSSVRNVAIVVESALTAVGFGIIVYSLYAR